MDKLTAVIGERFHERNGVERYGKEKKGWRRWTCNGKEKRAP